MVLNAAPPLTFGEDGAQLLAGAARPFLADLLSAVASQPTERAGIRLYGVKALRALLGAGSMVARFVGELLGHPHCQPVRLLLFDKTNETNWSLAWHQDRTICVAERREVAGFGPWSVKQGLLHVAPPFGILAGMATLRIHLDDVPETNAPLLIAPGSHRFGLVPEPRIEDIVERCGEFTCLAEAGDIWAYATPILHASVAAEVPRRRRVLQVDYAGVDLPGGLEWLGI